MRPRQRASLMTSCGLGALALGCAHQPPSAGAPPATADVEAHHGHHAAGMPGNLGFERLQQGPDDYAGGLAYDRDSKRLFFVSYGPPANTKGPSTLYELEPTSGRVLASAALPLRGTLATPVWLDGFLYVAVYHESKIYKLAVDKPFRFGQVVAEVPLPKLAEVIADEQRDEVFRYPFFSFKGATRTGDGKILLHSDDLGELLTIDPVSGKVLKKVHTLHTLSSIATVEGAHGERLLVADANPRLAAVENEMRKFMWRGKVGIAPMASAGGSEEDGVLWMLIDADSGEVLASTWQPMTQPFVGNFAVVVQQPARNAPYGQFTILSTAVDGIVTVHWTPVEAPADSVGRTNASSR